MGEGPCLTQWVFQLMALQPMGKSSLSLDLIFLICAMGVLWYAEGVIQFEFPRSSLDSLFDALHFSH